MSSRNQRGAPLVQCGAAMRIGSGIFFAFTQRSTLRTLIPVYWATSAFVSRPASECTPVLITALSRKFGCLWMVNCKLSRSSWRKSVCTSAACRATSGVSTSRRSWIFMVFLLWFFSAQVFLCFPDIVTESHQGQPFGHRILHFQKVIIEHGHVPVVDGDGGSGQHVKQVAKACAAD